ncbi:cell division protein FtsL [Pelagovum pacificum]|uniref:Cell division protein FtsL n=1 Tax=Pelagovum pacificum TaxID=2588711 RepID=A0A5C5GFI5_9RHOB|nr:cell division protein FtsL [Pelagovum pacificum]QQA44156.1 cell division protein FtsL [Pelagovum pacificum]TNY32719.1 cell division protein FtsL [Pelagovum pacificum]
MRMMLYLVTALGVIALAFWAYDQNYRTQAAIRDVRELHREIGTAHERLNVLKAEWAYLNRPDRLRDLTELNYSRLELLPLMPDGFGRIDEVNFPIPPLSPILDPVEIASQNADGEEFP